MTVITDARSAQGTDVAADVDVLMRDGVVGRKGAFPREWVEQTREDMMSGFWSSIQRPGGTVPRGFRRWYVELYPEQLSGFVDLVTHPWVTAVAEAVLGPDYRFVEVGFDVPFQGARYQPWHRDFRAPPEEQAARRLTALAFNVTGVDVTPDMGPFEIAPGTHWDDGQAWKHEMFPPREEWGRFEQLGVRKFPQMGDVSARSGLAVHRGTPHASPIARPVLVLGAVSLDVIKPEGHDLGITKSFAASLPAHVREHLLAREVDELQPIVQRHDIEGLMMGNE